MKFGIDVSKILSATESILGKDAAIANACARGVTRAALQIAADAKKSILKGPKSGHVYGEVEAVRAFERAAVGGTRKEQRAAGKHAHQASAPGEAPANDTGNLARSIFIVQAEPGVSRIKTAWVKTRNKYAAALEWGTKDIEPRPFMRPALNKNRGFITSCVQEEIQKALGEGGTHA